LRGANLHYADLTGANLEGATNITNEELEKQAESLKGATMPDGKMYRNSRRADLSEVDLSGVDLSGVDLKGANLEEANLERANLEGANLEEANLRGIFGITNEELENQAKSLKGATMPDGSKHD
jgi:uncharacterized protein YjbI with pentapeptide repeats